VDDDPMPRFESIDDHTIYWVKRAAQSIRQAEAFYVQISDTATRHLALMAMTLWEGVTARRRWARHYMVHVYHVDPQQLGLWTRLGRVGEGRWPTWDEAWDVFKTVKEQYELDDYVARRMWRTHQFALTEGREPWSDMVRVWRDAQDRIVADVAARMGEWNDEATRAASSIWIAGYVFAHLNLWLNKRLWARLGPGSHSERERRLALELPGAGLAAWHDGRTFGDVRRLPLEAARILEGNTERRYRPPRRGPKCTLEEIDRISRRNGFDPDLSRWAEVTTDSRVDMDPVGENRSSDMASTRSELQDFEARELAAQLSSDDFELAEAVRALREDYGLSERQAMVAFVCERYPEWTLCQVGAALGLAEGTVKTHRRLARIKLARSLAS